jgi:hypothetical protein
MLVYCLFKRRTPKNRHKADKRWEILEIVIALLMPNFAGIDFN